MFVQDALRLYLINSPVVRAEPLRFKKDGVFAVVKYILYIWWHSISMILISSCSNYFGKAFKLFSPNLKYDDINAGERCFLAMVQCI